MITQNEILHVAALARIHLKDSEVESLSKDLSKIIDHVNQLNKLNVKDVLPTSHVVPMENVYRKDEVVASLPREEVLAIAVQHDKGMYKVPKIIE